ncbi:MAG: dockerin type I repeat-containing protein, partial [Clostridia bacterium]|nr:dockerin type I repeat-containing protein [Clostridia bacterium]
PSIYVAPPAGKELDAYEINGVRYEINSVYNLTSDITIKALWKTKGTQVMVMDLNGGTSEGVSPYVEYKKNDKITLNFVAENNITPPKGKTFDAYEIDGIRYEAGSTYTVTKTFTVKVLWKDAALYGDLDGNDAINASDALLVLQISVNKVVPTDLQRIAADVNGDGVISAPDALLILQHSVAKIAKFPIEK